MSCHYVHSLGTKLLGSKCKHHNTMSLPSLTRKGVVYSLENLVESPEWDTWVDYSSPHARLVGRSHFPCILQKCIWYAMTSEDIKANLRSVMWGVGIKGYPTRWWLPTLRKFHRSTTFDGILPLDLLLLWVQEGKAFYPRL